MAKFRNRPITIKVDAEQWTPNSFVEGVFDGSVSIEVRERGFETVIGSLSNLTAGPDGPRAWLTHGTTFSVVNPFDWIVTYEDGRRVVMDPETFERTFEPVP